MQILNQWPTRIRLFCRSVEPTRGAGPIRPSLHQQNSFDQRVKKTSVHLAQTVFQIWHLHSSLIGCKFRKVHQRKVPSECAGREVNSFRQIRPSKRKGHLRPWKEFQNCQSGENLFGVHSENHHEDSCERGLDGDLRKIPVHYHQGRFKVPSITLILSWLLYIEMKEHLFYQMERIFIIFMLN